MVALPLFLGAYAHVQRDPLASPPLLILVPYEIPGVHLQGLRELTYGAEVRLHPPVLDATYGRHPQPGTGRQFLLREQRPLPRSPQLRTYPEHLLIISHIPSL